MHMKRITVTKENKFGDRYTVEREQLVYDNETERNMGKYYNRIHSDSYSVHYRKQSDSTHQANISEIFDAIDEYLDMLSNLQ